MKKRLFNSYENLPESYNEIFSVNLQKNKKVALVLNIVATAVALIMVVPMCFVVPISSLFSMEEGIGRYILRFSVILICSVLYLILHEAVHGIAMKICGTKKIKYGFTGMFAYAGSKDYYDKKSYIFIALAPVVLWGIVLLIINLLVPYEWIWVVYIIQVSNIGGAVGDFYVTFKFSRFPSDILITDSGLGMTVYSAEK
ncbi:MAG: DUF3267 domain-containing protein [Clostridia bacterium]|nr:DUF3267 domain-containing protein [Clostridia bacterium]